LGNRRCLGEGEKKRWARRSEEEGGLVASTWPGLRGKKRRGNNEENKEEKERKPGNNQEKKTELFLSGGCRAQILLRFGDTNREGRNQLKRGKWARKKKTGPD